MPTLMPCDGEGVPYAKTASPKWDILCSTEETVRVLPTMSTVSPQYQRFDQHLQPFPRAGEYVVYRVAATVQRRFEKMRARRAVYSLVDHAAQLQSTSTLYLASMSPRPAAVISLRRQPYVGIEHQQTGGAAAVNTLAPSTIIEEVTEV